MWACPEIPPFWNSSRPIGPRIGCLALQAFKQSPFSRDEPWLLDTPTSLMLRRASPAALCNMGQEKGAGQYPGLHKIPQHRELPQRTRKDLARRPQVAVGRCLTGALRYLAQAGLKPTLSPVMGPPRLFRRALPQVRGEPAHFVSGINMIEHRWHNAV